MSQMTKQGAVQVLKRNLSDLEVAAIPTKPDVFTACGSYAADLRDAFKVAIAALCRSEQKPRPYPYAAGGLKYQEAFVFEAGSLTIRTSGHGDLDGSGWFCFDEDPERTEYDEETGRPYQVIRCDNSELIHLRDKLNEIFPLTGASQ